MDSYHLATLDMWRGLSVHKTSRPAVEALTGTQQQHCLYDCVASHNHVWLCPVLCLAPTAAINSGTTMPFADT